MPSGTLVFPEINRSGYLIFRCRFGEKIFRAIHLRGFTFTFAFFEPSAHVAIRALTAAEYLHSRPKAILLRPKRQEVHVKCGGINAYEALKNSRNFIFDKHSDSWNTTNSDIKMNQKQHPLQGVDSLPHR